MPWEITGHLLLGSAVDGACGCLRERSEFWGDFFGCVLHAVQHDLQTPRSLSEFVDKCTRRTRSRSSLLTLIVKLSTPYSDAICKLVGVLLQTSCELLQSRFVLLTRLLRSLYIDCGIQLCAGNNQYSASSRHRAQIAYLEYLRYCLAFTFELRKIILNERKLVHSGDKIARSDLTKAFLDPVESSVDS